MSGIQIFTSIREMAEHGCQNDLILVSFHDTIYDLTYFIDLHPGGSWMIKAFSGQCIDEVLFNEFTHMHKNNVLDKLTTFIYGYIDAERDEDTQSLDDKRISTSLKVRT